MPYTPISPRVQAMQRAQRWATLWQCVAVGYGTYAQGSAKHLRRARHARARAHAATLRAYKALCTPTPNQG